MVFALEIGFFFAWLSYAGHLDRKELAEWQNPTLLDQVTGTLYATDSKGPSHGLRVFDPHSQTWNPLTNCPSLDPCEWDVEGRVCAFVRGFPEDWKKRRLVIARLPYFSVLQEIGIARFMDNNSDSNANWQGVSDLALSPDARYLAILFRYADAVAYKDRSSYYNLRSKCRLIVLNVDSGKEIARAPRWASDSGLCWLPDARTVLFPSFDDEKLYDKQKSEVSGNTSYGTGYSKDGKFTQSIFSFNLDTGKIIRFSDGHHPSLAVHKQQVLVQDDTLLRLLDSSGQEKARLEVPRLGYCGAVVSPDAALILVGMEAHSPFGARGIPVVLVTVAAPHSRHVLPHDFSYKYVWAEGIEAASSQASEVSTLKLAESQR